MIAIAQFIAALVLCVAAEAGARLDALHPATALLWPFLAYPLAAVARRGGRLARVAGQLLQRWPALAQGLAVGLSGWLAVWQREDAGSLFEWPGPELLLVLAPFACALFATTDAVLRGALPWPRRRSALAVQARGLLVVLLPMLVYIALVTPMRHSADLRAVLEEVRLAERGWMLLLLLLLGGALPWLVRLGLWLEPVPACALRDIYESVATRLRFRSRGLFLWRTGGHEINAAVVGFARWHRFVMVTDGLAHSLDVRRAEALFGHEIGHAARGHVVLFAAFSIGLLGLGQVALDFADLASPVAWSLLVLLLATWFVGFGWLSRRAELEADLVAASLGGGAEPLVELLESTTTRRSRQRHGWRHFSPSLRANFARAAQRHIEVGLRLERTLRRASAASLAAALVAVIALAATASRHADLDWAHARMRRGEFAEAAERAQRAGDLELAELARLGAAEFENGAIASRADLELRARSAFERGDLDLAQSYLDLATWRGEGRLGAAGRALAAELELNLRADPAAELDPIADRAQ